MLFLRQAPATHFSQPILARRCAPPKWAVTRLLKGTQVDGVYSADPNKDPSAERFDRLTYHDVLKRDLRVMDQAAISLTRESNIPILVFALAQQDGIVGALTGRGPATIISND